MGRAGPAVVALTVLALTACGGTGSAEGDADRTGTSTPAASAPVPSAPAASPPAATVPATALLQAEDLDGVEPKPAGADVAEDLRPPRPCGQPYPSDPARLASVAVTAMVTRVAGQHGAPSVILETIVRYRPGAGAAAYSEVTGALRRCPGALGKDQQRWEIVGAVPAGGAEAIVFRTTVQFEYGDATNLVTKTTPVAVARVADHVVLVADLGWETSGGDEALVRTLIATAVERLRAAT